MNFCSVTAKFHSDLNPDHGMLTWHFDGLTFFNLEVRHRRSVKRMQGQNEICDEAAKFTLTLDVAPVVARGLQILYSEF